MFGYIKKSKVLEIIENGEKQLLNTQNKVVLMDKTNFTKHDHIDWRDSIKKLEGGMIALKDLKKHFR